MGPYVSAGEYVHATLFLEIRVNGYDELVGLKQS
jgi:hypothetical protein